ncbi:MAG: hypothetical protein WBC60_05310 [Cognaticolwellia sp.]
MNKKFLISLVSLSLLSLTTQAETLNKTLAQCAVIEDSLARLVCFDDLAKQPVVSVSTKTAPTAAVPVTKAEVVATPVTPAAEKAANFGAEHLKKSVVAVEENLQIVFTVAKLKQDPYGKWRFTFKNGQQWKQTDSNRFRIKVGDSVLLSKGVMGSVYLKKNKASSNKEISVKRIK